MSLLTRDYDYVLPEALIASRPLARRDDSRMMVLYRAEERIEHRAFRDFPDFMREGDLVVLNDTRVIPARVFTTEKIELLFLEEHSSNVWKCMVKPGRKMPLGKRIDLAANTGEVVEIFPTGERLISFSEPVDFKTIGHVPLPPYMNRASDADDLARYQTTYARSPGAIAAPTAGLHFTAEGLEKIPHAFVTLHVGAGTFKPVQTENLREHRMHSEKFVIESGTAGAINHARQIVAVGTTTLRVLESCVDASGEIQPQEGATDIFIYPPYEFRAVDALLTNFHLPRSTLLMLVSAFAGREFILRAYAEAICERYRFFSYGDCMLIL